MENRRQWSALSLPGLALVVAFFLGALWIWNSGRTAVETATERQGFVPALQQRAVVSEGPYRLTNASWVEPGGERDAEPTLPEYDELDSEPVEAPRLQGLDIAVSDS